jgi:hypothetical protein
MTLLQRYLQREEATATALMKQCDIETMKLGLKKEKASGLEARAALRLRVEVMGYVLRVDEAIRLLQRRFRGLTRRINYLRLQAKRLQVLPSSSPLPPLSLPHLLSPSPLLCTHRAQ